jgi:hypothetical protein
MHRSDTPNPGILANSQDRSGVIFVPSESKVRRSEPDVQNVRNDSIHLSESSESPGSFASPIGRGRRGMETAVMEEQASRLVDVEARGSVAGEPVYSD